MANEIDLDQAKKAAEEVKAGTRKFDLPETHDIGNVPIFAAGTWNGGKYTESDIDSMIAAFEDTKKFMKPYLKLGHDNKQKLVQQDGFPSAGWIEGLRRVGKQLYADFSGVPKKVYNLVRAGAFKKISAEIFIDRDFEGKKYPYMLKAASFLGADWPGVHTLDDIIALYALGGEVKADEEKHNSKVIVFDLITTQERQEINMTEQLQKDLAEALKNKAEADIKIKELSEKASRVEALETENGTLKASLSDAMKNVGELENQVSTFRAEKRETEVNATIEKYVQEKRLTPAQKPYAFALLMNATTEKKFKIGDKEQTLDEIAKALFAANTVSVNTEEQTEVGEAQTNDETREEFAKKAHEYKEKHKVSFKEAVIALSPSNKGEDH